MTPAALEFTVHGAAQPKGSTRAFVPKGWSRPIITSDNKGLKAWEDTIRGELQRVMSETDGDVLAQLFEAPLAITLRFHLPRPKSLAKRVVHATKKPDLDKLARGAIDALNGVLFKDDAQIVSIHTVKAYADAAPFVTICVRARIHGFREFREAVPADSLFDFREESTL